MAGPSASEKSLLKDVVSADSNSKKQKVVLTYIDTLNANKELALLDSTGRLTTGFSPQNSSIAPDGAQKNRTDKLSTFKVQCYALKQYDQALEKEKELKAKLNMPVTIMQDQGTYKVLVGDFSVRSGADSLVVKLRQSGFPDAWVVKPGP